MHSKKEKVLMIAKRIYGDWVKEKNCVVEVPSVLPTRTKVFNPYKNKEDLEKIQDFFDITCTFNNKKWVCKKCFDGNPLVVVNKDKCINDAVIECAISIMKVGTIGEGK